jgi:hypothetical protein
MMFLELQKFKWGVDTLYIGPDLVGCKEGNVEELKLFSMGALEIFVFGLMICGDSIRPIIVLVFFLCIPT